MIDQYNFDNANADGDKEAVVVPNVPTLINKLSAHETNGIRDKINEIRTFVNTLGPVPYPELRPFLKGDGNTADFLQVGDVVQGFKDGATVWLGAIYNGGDPTNRDNYTPVGDDVSPPEPILISASATGSGQVFTVPEGFVAGSVLKSRGELFKGSEWTQTGNSITILVNVNTGNSIYIKP